MISSELSNLLCKSFCEEIIVKQVPAGLAVSTSFADNSGDRISFYAVETADGWHLEDDGEYLANLVARDIPITEGVRSNFLSGILEEGNAYWDQETFEIKTNLFSAEDLKDHMIPFLSSLIRVRDLELLTRENIKSTFREDVICGVKNRFGAQIDIDEYGPVANDFSEFPADFVIRPKSSEGIPAAIYLVNSNDKLNEALLASQESVMYNRNDFKIVGIIEDAEMRGISKRRFQRAQNRRLLMPIFRGDEESAITLVGREMGLHAR